MSNKFCRFLSNGYRIGNWGQEKLVYTPCCYFTGQPIDIDSPDFNEQHARIASVQDWIKGCNHCKQIEESGAYKIRPRQRSFIEIPVDIPSNNPGWFEITIDNTCNAACLSCGPYYSSLWEQQEIKAGTKTADDLPDMIPPLDIVDRINKKFSFNDVQYITFLGGEPFLSFVPVKFLQKIQECKELSSVVVHFQSNASVKPKQELVDLLIQCQSVNINLSIDGYSEKNEYLRWPLGWNKITEAIEFYKSLHLPHSGGAPRLAALATINPMNAYYYGDLEEWLGKQSINLNPNRCHGKMDLVYTPNDLRAVIVDKYGTDHPVSKMFSNLERPRPYTEFISHLDFWDKIRNNSWRKTFPEMEKFYDT